MNLEEIRARITTIENLDAASESSNDGNLVAILEEKVALYEAVLERVGAICSDPGLAEEQHRATITSLCGELAGEALRAREVRR